MSGLRKSEVRVGDTGRQGLEGGKDAPLATLNFWVRLVLAAAEAEDGPGGDAEAVAVRAEWLRVEIVGLHQP